MKDVCELLQALQQFCSLDRSRPELKLLTHALVEAAIALLVGAGARTLTLRDALEAAVDGRLTAGTSALASTGRPFEFTRAA